MTRISIAVLVALHLAVVVWHGSAHTTLAIALTPAKTAFVFIVILIAPPVGAALMLTRYVKAGAWIVVLSMFSALFFGVYHHYIMISPDNVAHLPDGNPAAQSTFVATAGALALLELVTAVCGAVYVRSLRELHSR
jgi:hypothetical protein